jgi:transposase-like protein
MHHVHLNPYQRHRLQEITRSENRFKAHKAVTLLELDSGSRIQQVCRNLGITDRTLRNWIVDFDDAKIGDCSKAWKTQTQSQCEQPNNCQSLGYCFHTGS